MLAFILRGARAGMRLVSRTAAGRGAGPPAPRARPDCPGPTFAVFLLLYLINKAAVLSCWWAVGTSLGGGTGGLEGPLWGEAQALSTTRTPETSLSPRPAPWPWGCRCLVSQAPLSFLPSSHFSLPLKSQRGSRPALGMPQTSLVRARMPGPVTCACVMRGALPLSPERRLTVPPRTSPAGFLSQSSIPGLGEPWLTLTEGWGPALAPCHGGGPSNLEREGWRKCSLSWTWTWPGAGGQFEGAAPLGRPRRLLRGQPLPAHFLCACPHLPLKWGFPWRPTSCHRAENVCPLRAWSEV